MTTVTIQQAFEACQTNKNTWLKRKAELADLEREYREQLLAGDEQIPRRMQDLRDNIDVKKWEINQAAGRYIRSHEEVQHISIRNRLHDFMQQHGAELAATLAPELMGYHEQIPAVKQSAMQPCSTRLIICVKPCRCGWPQVKKLIIPCRTTIC